MSPEKQDVIGKILSNRTYLPRSGMYKMVERALIRLSLVDLKALSLIIDLKVTEAIEDADRICPQCGGLSKKSDSGYMCSECAHLFQEPQ